MPSIWAGTLPWRQWRISEQTSGKGEPQGHYNGGPTPSLACKLLQMPSNTRVQRRAFPDWSSLTAVSMGTLLNLFTQF